MSTWYKKELGDAVMAAPELETLKEQFAATFKSIDDGEPALFTHYDSPGGLHCEVTIYFSPTAAPLAAAVNAQPCAKPAITGLSLLAGNKNT